MQAVVRYWRQHSRDAWRPALQAALAAGIAFGIAYGFALPDYYWAVITALFAVQDSVGATIGTALLRVGGALIGTLIGLAFMSLGVHSNWQAAGPLILAGGIMGFISASDPALRYGVVTATILILLPGKDYWTTAWQYSLQIVIGTSIGTLVTIFVFPRSAHGGSASSIGHAVADCGAALLAIARSLAGEAWTERIRALNKKILTELREGEALAGHSRRELSGILPSRSDPGALLPAVQHLWHTIMMVNRAAVGRLPDGPRERLQPELDKVLETAHDFLERLGRSMEKATPPPPHREVARALDGLAEAIADIRRERRTHHLEDEQAVQFFALVFALGQLRDDLTTLARASGEFAGTASSDEALQNHSAGRR